MYRLTLAELVKESKKTDRRVDVDYLNPTNPFHLVYFAHDNDGKAAITVTDMPYIHELPKTAEQTINRALILISGVISYYFHDLLRKGYTVAQWHEVRKNAYLEMAELTLSPAHFFILAYHVAQESNRIRTLAHERYQREQAEERAA